MIAALVIAQIIFLAVRYGREILMAATSLPCIGGGASWTFNTFDAFKTSGPLSDLVFGVLLIQLFLMVLGIVLHVPRLAAAVDRFVRGHTRPADALR